MSYRPKRVADEIRKVISERLVKGLKDPLPGFVTVRDVEVNRDFSQAKVYVSVFGSDEDKAGAIEVLNAHKGAMRRELGQKVRLRNTPSLTFELDESGERAARIHKLLDDVRPDEAETASESGDAGARKPGKDDEGEAA